jgi:hypothetical protein
MLRPSKPKISFTYESRVKAGLHGNKIVSRAMLQQQKIVEYNINGLLSFYTTRTP